ncbi:hypothetical protein ACR9E3_12585 [Actinomycetospora sp. C-140]
MARVIGTIVILLVLYAIISNPQQAASTTRSGASTLADAGSSITVFLSNVVNDVAVSTGSSTSNGTTTYPSGGIETGDGSTPIDR